MYTIELGNFGTFREVRLANTETDEYVACIPDLGGTITQINLKANQKLYPILEDYRSEAGLGVLKGSKGIKLSPFPNRIKDGKYEFEGKSYALFPNKFNENHAIHGFLAGRQFIIEEEISNKTEASLLMAYDYSGDMEGYPFTYRLQMLYQLNSDGFSCTTKIINTHDSDLPIGDGWHPYFTFNCKVNDLELQLPELDKIEIDQRMIPTGKVLPYSQFKDKELIDKQLFDTCFKLKHPTGIQKARLINPTDNVAIELWQKCGDNGYNFLQVYIPPERKSIAFEPMTCNVDVLNNKDGLIVLSPGQSVNLQYGVSLLSL